MESGKGNIFQEIEMDGFIDIHSHILPELDDGSESMEQTIRMVKLAFEEGTRTIVATPHYCCGRYEPSPEILQDSLQKVQEAIKDKVPDMNLMLGSEIYYSQESIRLLRNNRILTLAGTGYVLLEFSPLAEFRYIKNGLQEFIMEGYNPILAHVERYWNVIKDLEQVQDFIEMGVGIQVNAMSVTGEMGKGCQAAVKKLLKNQSVHLIATDAHNLAIRAPRLRKCYGCIVKKYGNSYGEELFYGNQKKILANQSLS